MRIGWQAPHRSEGIVPLQLIGLRVPRVAGQFHEIDGSPEPCLACAHPLLGTLLSIDILKNLLLPRYPLSVQATRRALISV